MTGRSDLATSFATVEAAVREAAPEDVPTLVGELERVKAIAWARLVVRTHDDVDQTAPEDRFLTAKQVHGRTTMSVAYLYRHAETLPFFGRRIGRKVLFSERQLERWLAKRSP
jgi:predicted DNA-binding transcriptional regulator AlpA